MVEACVRPNTGGINAAMRGRLKAPAFITWDNLGRSSII